MLISDVQVVTPANLQEALTFLQEHGDQARPLAGGTDAMVRFKEGHWTPPIWLNIQRLPELRGVHRSGDEVYIGAATPYSHLLRSPMLEEAAPLLLQAVRTIGSVQIRATGTLGGNLGTASPAGDAIPPLFCLEARVRLVAAAGERWLPVDQFCRGPGQTARRPDELIAGIAFAAQQPDELSLWQKLGLRGAQAISIISLAMRLTPGSRPGSVVRARFAYGAVGPTVLRARKCEVLAEQLAPLDARAQATVAQMAWKEVAPISDLRGSAEYRREMAVALMRRGLYRLLGSVPTGR